MCSMCERVDNEATLCGNKCCVICMGCYDEHGACYICKTPICRGGQRHVCMRAEGEEEKIAPAEVCMKCTIACDECGKDTCPFCLASFDLGLKCAPCSTPRQWVMCIADVVEDGFEYMCDGCGYNIEDAADFDLHICDGGLDLYGEESN